VTVGALKVEILVPGASSLKDKRRAVKSLKDRLRRRFNVSVAEVDHQDRWQRAAIGIAAVGTDGAFVSRVLDEVLGFIRRDADVELAGHEVEVF